LPQFSIRQAAAVHAWVSPELCRKLLLVSEISGGLVIDFRMASDAIVKHLNVFKDLPV